MTRADPPDPGRERRLVTPAELLAAVPAAAAVRAAMAEVRRRPEAIRTLFPAAGRRWGRGPLGETGWLVEDATRALLVTALPATGQALAGDMERLYRDGDTAEKRAVLRALDLVLVGEHGLPMVHDALRTNDPRLAETALGLYGAAYLPDDAYRHGVLKCVFAGVPLARVAGLQRRGDGELARDLAGFAAERTVAGRDVPEDVREYIDRFPEASGSLDAYLRSAHPHDVTDDR
ncbi:EboA domain-containing protein [Nonomuraea sp. NPDC051941]|uniref:EboA domain-containing protein n=1 Tax=Nonomuraea sp. NPDC051941 TaxID=3364373 RepID=UPI0037C51702